MYEETNSSKEDDAQKEAGRQEESYGGEATQSIALTAMPEEPEPPFKKWSGQLPTLPTVKVVFSGLLLIRAGANNSCDIGVHRWADTPPHTLRIALTIMKPGEDPIEFLYFSGLLDKNPFSITVTPPSGDGISAYLPSPTPFKRDEPANQKEDLRWALNVNWLHPNDVEVVPDGITPGITLNEGVLYSYFRTAKDDPKLELRGPKNYDLPSIGSKVGAAIPLTGSGQVILKWSEHGIPQNRALPRQGDPLGTRYIISISNEPTSSGAAGHDELEQYYKVLQKKSTGTQFPPNEKHTLKVIPKQTPLLKTDEIPCMPILGP
jgi:hypothetical protein